MIISKTITAVIDTECLVYETETENVYDDFSKNKQMMIQVH